MIADFEYDELDFARNRLGQRQRKQAHVEITKTDRATIVRLPASDRARSIVDDIRKRVAQAKQGEIAAVQLSLSALALPQERTAFFTKLISSIPKHTLQTVTGVRVATFDNAGPDDELDDDVGEATTKMLAVVNKVALGGENLIATDQFQQLSAAGFFIVAITWRAIQDDQPHDLIKFAISFDDPVGGNGIKYSVRHAPSVATDRYASGFRRLSDVRESSMLRLMETAAVDALAGLTKPADSGTNG